MSRRLMLTFMHEKAQAEMANPGDRDYPVTDRIQDHK